MFKVIGVSPPYFSNRFKVSLASSKVVILPSRDDALSAYAMWKCFPDVAAVL
jgi:hypothetical protein